MYPEKGEFRAFMVLLASVLLFGFYVFWRHSKTLIALENVNTHLWEQLQVVGLDPKSVLRREAAAEVREHNKTSIHEQATHTENHVS